MTSGLLVFVQLVIAAMTTAPWPIAPAVARHNRRSPHVGRGEAETALGGRGGQRLAKRRLHCPNGTRSCGRFGPARHGSIVLRSKRSVLLYSGVSSGPLLPPGRKSRCSFA